MSERSVETVVPAGHPAFAGHFPGRPIVPGVVLLDLVTAAVCTDAPRVLASVPNVKFLQPLRPDERFRIVWEDADGSVRFRCETAEALLAQGVLCFKNSAGSSQHLGRGSGS